MYYIKKSVRAPLNITYSIYLKNKRHHNFVHSTSYLMPALFMATSVEPLMKVVGEKSGCTMHSDGPENGWT